MEWLEGGTGDNFRWSGKESLFWDGGILAEISVLRRSQTYKDLGAERTREGEPQMQRP